MANRHKGEVDLVVGDKTYTLRLSTNALVIAEDLLDKGVSEIGEMLSDVRSFRVGTARALLFAGLHENHPDITLDDVGEIIGEIGIPAVIEKVGDSMRAAFPEPTPAENPQKAGPRGTGKASLPTS